MTKKVLVADDEEPVRALVAATLGSDERCELLLAKDGNEALQIAVREQPGLIFLDILMPGKDGYGVCRALRADARTRGARVVMLSALAQDSDVQKAREAGADDYVVKPFSPVALLRMVQAYLSEPANAS